MKPGSFIATTMFAVTLLAISASAAPGPGKGNGSGTKQSHGNQGAAPRINTPAAPHVQVAPQGPRNAAPKIHVPNSGPNNALNKTPNVQNQNPIPRQSNDAGVQLKTPSNKPRTNVISPPTVKNPVPDAVPRQRPQVTIDPNLPKPGSRNDAIRNEALRNNAQRNSAQQNNALNNQNNVSAKAKADFRPNFSNHAWYQGHWKGGPNQAQIAGSVAANRSFSNRNFSYAPNGYGYGGGYGGYGGYGYGYGIGGQSGLGTLLQIGLALSGNGGLGYGGYGGGYGPGYGGYGLVGGYPAGWGYGGWGLGRIAYSSGYYPYVNPYYAGGSGGGYNYARPIPAAVAANDAPSDTQLFDNAVAQFKAGDYPSALTTIDQAIQQNASDPVMHEFRALTLFALGNYPSSAATIHSVLAVGPGWNWQTLSSLYNDVGIYESQFRKLEQAAAANPTQADLHFLLAYHYLVTENNHDEAVDQLRKVVKLEPQDRLTADLLKMNELGQTARTPTPAPPSAQQTAREPKSIDPAALVGKWDAKRPDKSNFEINLAPDKTFTWKVDQQGHTETLSGTYDVEKDLLALESDKAGGMVGHVSLSDNDQFTFKLVGAPQDDAGLTFKKE